jgi:hypothetical protein
MKFRECERRVDANDCCEREARWTVLDSCVAESVIVLLSLARLRSCGQTCPSARPLTHWFSEARERASTSLDAVPTRHVHTAAAGTADAAGVRRYLGKRFRPTRTFTRIIQMITDLKPPPHYVVNGSAISEFRRLAAQQERCGTLRRSHIIASYKLI